MTALLWVLAASYTMFHADRHGHEKATITLDAPAGGWTAGSHKLLVKGSVSDTDRSHRHQHQR